MIPFYKPVFVLKFGEGIIRLGFKASYCYIPNSTEYGYFRNRPAGNAGMGLNLIFDLDALKSRDYRKNILQKL